MNLLFPIYPIVKKYKNLLYMRMKLCFNNVILMTERRGFYNNLLSDSFGEEKAYERITTNQ